LCIFSTRPGPKEYCHEPFNASCSASEVILMQTARYGRIQFGRCLREDHGSVGCSADVLPHLDGRCSARRSCSLNIPDPALHKLHQCPRELVPYLEASYICLKGMMYDMKHRVFTNWLSWCRHSNIAIYWNCHDVDIVI